MHATLDWQGNVKFNGRTESGHDITIDGPQAFGGQNAGARPMELILLGVGGCSAMDVIEILKKARQDIDDVRIELDGTRATSIPRVYTDIHLNFIVSGHNLNEKHVSRAVQLSVEKYCSAAIMLAGSVKVTHEYTIKEL